MSEWRILTAGIRALGWLFLIRAFADPISYLSLLFSSFSPRSAILVLAAIRIVIALGLIRYASKIAARLVDSDALAGLELSEDSEWNRWLFVAVLVYGVVTALPASVFNGARNALLSSNASMDGYGYAFGLLVVITVVFPLVALAAVLIRRNPKLITGKGTYDDR